MKLNQRRLFPLPLSLSPVLSSKASIEPDPSKRLSQEKLDELMDEVDLDGGGEIDFNEFLFIIYKWRSNKDRGLGKVCALSRARHHTTRARALSRGCIYICEDDRSLSSLLSRLLPKVLALAITKNLGKVGAALYDALNPAAKRERLEEEQYARQERDDARTLELREKFYEEAFFAHERARNEARRQRRLRHTGKR